MKLEEILEKYDYVIVETAKKWAERAKDPFIDWEDLAQECRIQLVEKREQIESVDVNNWEAFVCTICRNKCINYIRDTKKHKYSDNIPLDNM